LVSAVDGSLFGSFVVRDEDTPASLVKAEPLMIGLTPANLQKNVNYLTGFTTHHRRELTNISSSFFEVLVKTAGGNESNYPLQNGVANAAVVIVRSILLDVATRTILSDHPARTELIHD
jgi:hypothetical protein